MFKSLKRWFCMENLLAQAKDQVLEMLREDLQMFKDSVKCLWKDEGLSIDEIKERDREINRHVREVRKKVLTHLAFSGTSGLETCLVILSMAVDIERIGDHTKDITYLATNYPGKFNAGAFEKELKDFERNLAERLASLVDIVESEQDEKARRLAATHKYMDRDYCKMLDRLISEEETGLSHGQSAVLALYLRYLRRIDGHVFNIASAEVNPFHRIGFKVKKKKKEQNAESPN
jgi:phosphate uptake regulator